MEERITKKELKRRENLTSLKIDFNDICMRELGLDITEDDDLIYEVDTNEVLQYKERFMQYSEEYMPVLKPDKMEFNLLENCRLFDILFIRYLDNYAKNRNWQISAIYNTNIPSSIKGYAAFTIVDNGKSKEYRSDAYVNESIRLANLLAKLNGSDHLYDFNRFDKLYSEYK